MLVVNFQCRQLNGRRRVRGMGWRRIIGRGSNNARGQIDHLPGIDQAWVLDLWVYRQDIAPADADPPGNFPERISPLYHVGTTGGRVISCRAGSRWDIE